jgi:hypothetical protein
MEEVLGFCVVILTMVGIIGIAVWFCCSILESVIKTRRRLKNSRYGPLLRENERLKGFLADVKEENYRLREIYHSERIRRKSNNVRQNAA